MHMKCEGVSKPLAIAPHAHLKYRDLTVRYARTCRRISTTREVIHFYRQTKIKYTQLLYMFWDFFAVI